MASLTGPPPGRHPLATLRRMPLPGEVGCPGSCPLCSHAHGAPPCLACRDELRARLLEMDAHRAMQKALN